MLAPIEESFNIEKHYKYFGQKNKLLQELDYSNKTLC